MKKDNKTRLFEVMGRLDKTFKPKLNENIEDAGEEIEITGEISPESSINNMEEIPDEEKKELTPEEKLEALTAKIDSLYAMVHGDNNDEEEAEEKEEEIEGEPETEEGEEETEIELEEEKKPKIPVADIAKVGK